MPDPTKGRSVTQAELAVLFGVRPTTVQAWTRKGCPVERRAERGKAAAYNTAAVLRWREEQAALAATGDTSALDLEEAKRRKLAAEAALAELDLATRRGDLVPVEQVGAVVEAEYAVVRANLMSMPGEIAMDLEHRTAAEIEELLGSKVTDILNALAADGQFAAEGEAGEGAGRGAEATAETQPD